MGHGSRIRELRKRAGLTQAQLAANLSVGQPTICNVESGRKCMSLDLLLKYAQAIGCDPAEIDDRLASTRIRSNHPAERRG